MACAAHERVDRIIREVSGVKAQYGITEWEWGFLHRMRALAHRGFSEKQAKVIDEIEAKVFPTEDGES